jgi:hypothetical protein
MATQKTALIKIALIIPRMPFSPSSLRGSRRNDLATNVCEKTAVVAPTCKSGCRPEIRYLPRSLSIVRSRLRMKP